MLNAISGIVAYCLKKQKPRIKLLPSKLASLRIERARSLTGICIHTALNKIKSKLISCLVIVLKAGKESVNHFTLSPVVWRAPMSASMFAGATANT